jgi:hypothetical protein
VAHICDPSYLRGLWFKDRLGKNVFETPSSKEKHWAWWRMLIIPVGSGKLKIGGSWSRPAWAKNKTVYPK